MKPAAHVIVDARCVGRVPHGMHVFVTSLALGLEQLGSRPYRVTYLVSAENGEEVFGRVATARARTKFLSPAEWVEIPALLRSLGADLYHSPTFASLPFVGKPWIATVHDLNHLRFGNAAQKLYYRALLRPFVRGATRVCTVSEFARAEIADWAEIDLRRIAVTYNAIRAAAYQDQREPEPRFFCLTNPKPHKNTEFLLAAYGDYRTLCREQGVRPWTLQVTVPAAGRSLEGVEFYPGLSAEKVEALRARTGAVVFPSLYEGFGLPPVEAAVQGILPLVSRIAPHAEGLGELAADEAGWFDPQDRAGCARVLLNATLGQYGRPSRESANRIRDRFSVERLGRQMDQIYRDVLGV